MPDALLEKGDMTLSFIQCVCTAATPASELLYFRVQIALIRVTCFPFSGSICTPVSVKKYFCTSKASFAYINSHAYSIDSFAAEILTGKSNKSGDDVFAFTRAKEQKRGESVIVCE